MRVNKSIYALLFLCLYFFTSSSVLIPTAFGVDVTVPHVSGLSGTQISVPIRIGDTTELGILSVEISLTYKASILAANGVNIEDTIANNCGWANPTYNISSGQIIIWMSAPIELVGTGDLIKINFTVSGTAVSGDKTQLILSNVSLNESSIPAIAVDGSFICNSSITLNLLPGWNGISCPGDPAIIDWNAIKTNNPNITLIVEYDTIQKKFVTATNIEFGKSYFIGVVNNTQITMKYLPKDSLSLPVKAGWNPMGSVSSSISTGNISSDPFGKISLIVYYDHNKKKFVTASTIIPGVGYMTGCVDDCILSMDCSSLAPPVQRFEIEPSWKSILSVQTQTDYEDLIFGMNKSASDEVDLYDKPIPPFPEILGEVNAGWVMEDSAFDLLEQSFVKDDSEAIWKLSVELSENGEISWRNLPKSYRFILSYDNRLVNMHTERSLLLPVGKHTLLISVKSKASIPDKTSLLASYPNPCNPETWIPYELSNNTKVKIMIYSSNGNLVRSLDLGNKPVGRYVEQSKAAYWDGKNESGERVSSGIYFYTLVTPEFSQVRKLLIIR